MIYNPQEIEKKILNFWERDKLFEKSMKLRKGAKTFSFIDGPPTANNPMGVHHAWGRTYKDLYLRLKTMQGFYARKQPGFDCQGLWVEVGVEKELGFKTKKDIEKYGIDKFTRKCVKSVLGYVKIWINLSKKLGMWMDWENPYLTMSDTNIEYVWYFLKKCHEKGWLYKGLKVLPWCSRCGTSLSHHEVTKGYKELTHPAIYVKFPIKNRKNEYLLIYTTTPWTLVSNVAVAVHPDFEYSRVKVGDEVFIIAKNLVETVLENYEIIESVYGKKLVGLQYNNPMKDLLPIQQNITGRIVLSDKYVNLEEGTALVHIAPGHGLEDYEIGLEHKLPVLSPIDEEGKFNRDAGWLKGKNVKEASELVLEKLRERNVLYKETTLTHSYPCCWRCGEELVYRTGEEWFISSEEIKPKLIKEAKKVKWYPEWAQKSMIDWLINLRDWNISRKRYYGLPLPFWCCENGHLEVIGTREELKRKAIKGFDQLKELHRPWIDKIILKCPVCGKEMKRVLETGDCWLDAGVVPFSTLKYLEDRSYWKKWFPADFITEMHEQVRLWFYAMLFVSLTLENKTPYKSVLAHGMVLDEKGMEMHKSKGNVIWADDALSKMGADIMRWMYISQNPGLPLCFGYTPAKEVRRILNIFFNTGKYIETYCEANNYKPKKVKRLDITSRWIISRLESLKESVTKHLEDLRPHLAAKELQEFFLNDFSRFYIHVIRSRVKPGYEAKDKQIILYTLYTVMLDLLKLLAPFLPFLTEQLYQDFFRKFEKKESIHLMGWPSVNRNLIDKNLEEKTDIIKKVVEACYSARQVANIKLRWPVKRVVILTKDKKVSQAVKDLNEILINMCNTKKVIVRYKKPKGEFAESKFDFGSMLVDKELDKKLLEEALIKELIREIQAMRKKHGFVVKEFIVLTLNSDEKTNKILKKYTKTLKKEVGAKRIAVGKLKGKYKGSVVFKTKKMEIVFDRI